MKTEQREQLKTAVFQLFSLVYCQPPCFHRPHSYVVSTLYASVFRPKDNWPQSSLDTALKDGLKLKLWQTEKIVACRC